MLDLRADSAMRSKVEKYRPAKYRHLLGTENIHKAIGPLAIPMYVLQMFDVGVEV